MLKLINQIKLEQLYRIFVGGNHILNNQETEKRSEKKNLLKGRETNAAIL